MDRKTSKTLQKINMQEAMKFKKAFVSSEDLFENERDILKRQLSNPRITSTEKTRIKALLDNPSMYDTKQTINEEATKQIESNVEKRIRLAIKSGKLKPAKRDAFIRRQEAWAKKDEVKKDDKAEKYQAFMEGTLKNKKFLESWQRVEAEKQLINYGKEQGYI